MVNIYRALKMAAAGLGSTGLVITAAENYRHFSIALEENYWTVLAFAWVFSVVAIWPRPERKTILGLLATYKVSRLKEALRYKWIFLITVLFLGVGYYRYYVVTTPSQGSPPTVEPGDIPLPLGFYTRVSFQQSHPKEPKLLQFNLIPEKTLYAQIFDTYRLPYGVISRIYAGQCAEDFDASAALQALRNYARSTGKGRLLKYIDNEQQLKALVRDHPNQAKELLPSKSEWPKLDRPDYKALLSWVRSCVGIFFPVFLVTIENPNDHDILVTTVTYNIYRIETGRGEGRAGPLITTESYAHRIKIQNGSQPILLTPGFNIPARQNGSFEIQLWTNGIETPVDLDMNAEFTTSKGTVKTSRFHLILEVVPR